MTRQLSIFLPWVAALALAACAAPENQMLDQARAAYSAARNDPQIISNAPTELNQAAQALQEAEGMFERNADQDRVTHQAYVANQRVAIAREAAQLKMTQDVIAKAEMQRQEVLLQARSREAEMARQEAARKQKELERAQAQLTEAERARQAEIARQQMLQQQQAAEMARQEADAARQQAAAREQEIAELRQKVREAETRETPRGVVLTLKDVVFPVGQSELNPGAERSLRKIAEFLKENPDRSVAIEGFTDSTGSAEFNRQLSEARAQAVRDALVREGVDETRITFQGFGEQYPVANNTTPAGRQLNRRVEIVISSGPEAGSAVGAAGGKEMQRRAGTGSEAQASRGQMAGPDQLLGTTVRDRQGQTIGEVSEVISNFANGRASFARVTAVDGKTYLIPVSALTTGRQGNFVTLNVDRSRIENSPLRRQGMSEEQYGRELYEHYGLSYPWEDLP